MRTPTPRSSLSEDIAHRLIDGILNGRFRFGERLPPERELARYLNVGRPTLREAIRVLSMLGLVDVRHGDGTFVVDNHADFISRAFSWTILLDSKSIDELIDTRIAVESMLAELAAERASTNEIDELKRVLEAMRRERIGLKAFSKADLEFHLLIAKAARNLTLSRTLFAIQSLLKQWIERALHASGSGAADVYAQHLKIFEAIESRNSGSASVAMRDHVRHVGELLRFSIQANTTEVDPKEATPHRD